MKGKWLLVLLGVVVVLSLVMPGCTPDSAYDRALRSPTGLPLRNENLVCQDPGPHYTVRRGQSVELMNPCPVHPGGIIDGAWQDLSFGRDDFLISDCTGPFLPAPVNGISVNTMFGSPTKRSVFADSTAPPGGDIPFCYEYVSGLTGLKQNLGHGKLFVTVFGGFASFTLTLVNNVGGVISRPKGIDFGCGRGATCSASFTKGTTVDLFSEGPTTWSGCDSVDGQPAAPPPQSTRGGKCTVLMNTDRTVTVSP